MRISIIAALAAAFVSVSAASTTLAHEIEVGSLTLTDLWTRATPPGAPTGGGFLTITNHGSQADRLIAVSSPAAAENQIHEMAVVDGVMSMKEVPGIEIPAGGAVSLAPGGYHLMFIGLKQPLVEGEQLPVTLTFEKAGAIDTYLHVIAIGAMGLDGSMGEHQDH
jgi:copper(I)-binding protein